MVITVSDGQSIQAAVHSAAPGDTIQVQEGIYRESVIIVQGKERLRIVGAGPGQTILDGTNLGEQSGLAIDGAQGVTLLGLTVRNFSGNGVTIRGDENILRQCEITQCSGGGVTVEGERNVLYENHLHGNGQKGAQLLSGTDNYIISNRLVANSGPGLLVEEPCTGTLLLENEVAANGGPGIRVSASGCRLIGNRSQENQGSGIELSGAGDALLYGNASIRNHASGLALDARALTVTHNQLSENRNHGIMVESDEPEFGLVEALLYSNEMSNNQDAGFHGSEAMERLLLLQNSVEENGSHGLRMPGSKAGRILANVLHRNKGTGLHVGTAAEGSLIDENSIRDNIRNGLHLSEGGTGNALRRNSLAKNTPVDIHEDGTVDGRSVSDGNLYRSSSPPEVGG